MAKCYDTPADVADACLIQMADELNTGDILTLDSDFKDSDFEHYRWRQKKSFNLLIPLE
jgi:predicted nucleic acid-binding protein